MIRKSRKAGNPVRKVLGILMVVASGSCSAQAPVQQPQAGAWFAISPSSSGVLPPERFELEANSSGTLIRWAPFGKAPESWGSITLRPDGSIEFRWAANPTALCTLRRTDDRTYDGMCQGAGLVERPLTLTQNQPPNGLELPLSDADFQILAKARQILSTPSIWNRHDDRFCEDDAKQKSWSLFCALYQASVDVASVYSHRRPVMEDVRAVVGEVTNGRSFEHILRDYNNLEVTTYADIAMILDRTEKRLQARKVCTAPPGPDWSADAPYKLPAPGNVAQPQDLGVTYWSETVSHTVQNKTFRLLARYGPITASGHVPDVWLAASSSATRRTRKLTNLEDVDARGQLPNGNHWRYASQCGNSLMYYDVPTEVAAFFNRIMDGLSPTNVHR